MLQDLSLSHDALKQNSSLLAEVLSNEYFLFLKTLNVHWNVTGQNFSAFHKLLEEQYEWLKQVVDDVAERIRTLGCIAPAHYSEYKDLSDINEGKSDTDFSHMLKDLCHGHEKVIALLRQVIKKMGKTDDFGSEDLLIAILREHEKTLWMLSSHVAHK